MPNIALQSAQSLFLKMQFNGQLLSTATGFVVAAASGPLLITNRHNVTGLHQDTNQPLSKTGGLPNEVIILHNRKKLLGQWVPRLEPLYEDSAPRWREHPRLGAKADFVALPLSQLDDVELYPYSTSSPGPQIVVGPSDVLSVVGFPFGVSAGGLFAVWATGFAASEPAVNFDSLPIQLIDCRTRQGQSESPRDLWRLHHLREWSHEEIYEVFTRVA